MGKSSLDNVTFRLDLHFSSRERVLSSKLNQILLFNHIWHFKQWNGLSFPQLQAANNEKDIQGGDNISAARTKDRIKSKPVMESDG